MNYTIFLLLLNLIMLSRLRFTMRDEGVSDKRDFVWITVIPLFALPFLNFNLSWILLAGYLLIHPFILYRLEKRKDKLNRNRLLLLIANILAVGILVSPLFKLQFANWFPVVTEWFLAIFFGGKQLFTLQHFNILLFGFLMILNESNIVIRFILEKLELTPLSNDHQKTGENQEIDNRQFRTGRVIGFWKEFSCSYLFY